MKTKTVVGMMLGTGQYVETMSREGMTADNIVKERNREGMTAGSMWRRGIGRV